jgi:hypothetical protein
LQSNTSKHLNHFGIKNTKHTQNKTISLTKEYQLYYSIFVYELWLIESAVIEWINILKYLVLAREKNLQNEIKSLVSEIIQIFDLFWIMATFNLVLLWFGIVYFCIVWPIPIQCWPLVLYFNTIKAALLICGSNLRVGQTFSEPLTKLTDFLFLLQ